MQLLICLLPFFQSAIDGEATRLVGQAYIEEILIKRDFEAAEFLAAPDMLWIDPTAQSLASPLAKGVRGRAACNKIMQSFALGGVKIEADYAFSSGPYYCLIGSFSVAASNPAAPTAFPFTTLLKIEDEQVIERCDFGDYDVYLPVSRRIDGIESDLEHPMVLSAKAYVDAYGKRDFLRMAELRADEVLFQDRTAVRIGGGTEVEGNANLLQKQERGLGSLPSFDIQTDYTFFHGEFAFFAGQVSYSLPGKQLGLHAELFSITHPLAIVLQFQEGKIIRHDDLADYDSYAEALKSARAAQR